MSDFTDLLDTFREERKIRKKDLADLAGLSAGYITLLTRGSRRRPSRGTVRALADALKLDNEERALLLKAAGYASYSGLPASKQLDALSSNPEGKVETEGTIRQYWYGAPDVSVFLDRTVETEELSRWVCEENCQLVAIFGLGGVGKTTFAVNLVHQLANRNEFDNIFWYSLLNAPKFDKFLERCFGALSASSIPADISDDSDSLIESLIRRLKEVRCLLILDNFESVLRGGATAGYYESSFEGYGRLLQRIAETEHKSCLLLTSREKPKGIASLEGKKSPVRSKLLSGLDFEQGHNLLGEEELIGTEEEWKALVDLYSGNPLYLKIISEVIQELFSGKIANFLKQRVSVVGDIRDPLDFQFSRLSDLERKIMFWLAIERIKVTLDDLREDVAFSVSERALLGAIGSLHRRSLIIIDEDEVLSLQPVIMEYVTDQFVSNIWSELDRETIELFGSHALIKASANDNIRERQLDIILRPIARRLFETLGNAGSEKRLKKILTKLREVPSPQIVYAAGNILNLFMELQIDVRGYDFSELVVRQAYLRGKSLPSVNFERANLRTSVFTESFGSVLTVAFSPDQKYFAAGATNGEIRLWEVASRAPHINRQEHTDWVRSIAFSPDGKTIASGSDDTTVRLWDVDTGNSLNELKGHSDWVWSVAFSPDGRVVASGSYDKTLRLWDVQSGQCLKVLKGHSSFVHAVAFSPNGKIIASGSADQTIRLWDVESGHCYEPMEGQGNIVSIAFSLDGKTIASGSPDEPVRLWDVSTKKSLCVLWDHDSRVVSVAFSPNGKIVAGACDDQAIHLWEVDTGKRLNTLHGHSRISAIAFSRDGKTIVSGGEDQTVRLWDVGTGESITTLQGYSAWIWSVAFSPDGKSIATGSQDPILRLWNVQNGSCVKLTGHSRMIYGVAFSPDGRTIASGSEDCTICLWNAHTGQNHGTLRGHSHWVYAVAFSPDGKTIGSGSWDETVRLWDVDAGESRIVQKDFGRVYAVAFSPDGKIIASASEDLIIRLWDVRTGSGLGTLRGNSGRIWSLAFSPDGKTIASGSEDRTVRLWNISTGKCERTLRGHSGYVRSIAFSPDGESVASGSHDKTIRVWNVSTGDCLQKLKGHGSWVWSLAFSPDGKTIASGSHEGKLILWDARSGELLKTYRNERPYDGMRIKDIIGITEAQKTVLLDLGASED